MTKSNPFDAINFQRRFLLLTGHWPEQNGTFFKKFRSLLSCVIAAGYVVMTSMELRLHFHDYDILSDHLSVMIPPTSFLIKLILFKLAEEQFFVLISQTDCSSFKEYPDEFDVYMENTIKLCTFIGKLYTGFCSSVIALYCMIPLFGSFSLPIRFSYHLESWQYISMYVFQSLALINAASNNACLDISSASFMALAAAQFDILNCKIVDFAKNFESKNFDSMKSAEVRLNKYLNGIVDHHNDLIRYVASIENVFSLVFLTQYLTSILVICNIGFQLTHNDAASFQFIKMLLFFVSMMLQLGMYCWFGNEVFTKSMTIVDACYQSDWPNCGKTIRKSLTIIMQRCKKPTALTSGKFSRLSLASFGGVLNASYSYFALMQRLYSKNVE